MLGKTYEKIPSTIKELLYNKFNRYSLTTNYKKVKILLLERL